MGLFIGVLSAIIFLLVLRTAVAIKEPKHLSGLIAQLVALASFSLGGSWLATELLKTVDRSDFLGPYLLTFTVTFFTICSKGLYLAMVKFGNQIRTEESTQQ